MDGNIRNLGTPVVQVPGFPFPTRLRENMVVTTVATTPTEVLHNNPNRLFWYVENRSSSPMYLGFNGQVSSSAGRLFDSNGGWVSMTRDEDGDPTGWQVFAVSGVAAGTIYSMEIERIVELES